MVAAEEERIKEREAATKQRESAEDKKKGKQTANARRKHIQLSRIPSVTRQEKFPKELLQNTGRPLYDDWLSFTEADLHRDERKKT
jgi:hypothetical protein